MRFFLSFFLLTAVLSADTVVPRIPQGVSRPFVSGEVWTVPMEDWLLDQGKIVNRYSGGDRKVVSLGSELLGNHGFEMSVQIDQVSDKLKSKGFVGFQIGLQGRQLDYRESVIYGAGFPVGILPDGRLFIGKPEEKSARVALPLKAVTLVVKGVVTQSDTYALNLTVLDAQGGKVLAQHVARDVHRSWIKGLVALTVSTKPAQSIKRSESRPPTSYGGITYGRMKSLVTPELKPMSQGRSGEARFAFSDWKISGAAVKKHEDRDFGPIWWSTYTVDDKGVLRLLVQMAPVLRQRIIRGRVRPTTVLLHLGGKTHEAVIEADGYTALFKVPLTDVSQDSPYTVEFDDFGKKAIWKGIVRAVPTAKKSLVVASLSCNDSTGFPHAELVANVTAHKADVITFHGDQIYEGIGGYGYIVTQKPSERANVSYLRKYAMHGWSWRELLATTPSITIPDDHDVMHGNIWGEGGKAADMSGNHFFEAQDSGGYKMSAEFVNMVHRTQTGNLPTADDQPTCLQGISTYHSTWRYGPLDFIILADRQFKSAPRDRMPEAKIHNGWPQNLKWSGKTDSRISDVHLLGTLQEAYLKRWAESPSKKSPFRIVISQSPWLAPQTLPKSMHHDKDVPKLKVYKKGGYAPNDEPKADFDTNGWPQDKQKLALRLMKKANALHITGDQHLGTTGQYGIDGYDDGPWWISSPAIANVWPRRWMPSATPVNAKPSWPRWKGGFEDGFGNKFTMHAVANPTDLEREPARLFDRAVGYTITTYDVSGKKISLANWPYMNGPQLKGEDSQPYPGWPIVIQK